MISLLQELCNTVHTRAEVWLGNRWNTGQAGGSLRIPIDAKIQQQRGGKMPERSMQAKAHKDHPRAYQWPKAAAYLGRSVWELCDPDSVPALRGKKIKSIAQGAVCTNLSNSFIHSFSLTNRGYNAQDATVEAAMVKAIKPHVGALRSNMFGKRILSKTSMKNRKFWSCASLVWTAPIGAHRSSGKGRARCSTDV